MPFIPPPLPLGLGPPGLTTLIFKSRNAKIDTLSLDASISESHDAEVTVTKHPVEQGAAISDHARPEPLILTIEGLVSNTPINAAFALGGSSFPIGAGGQTFPPGGQGPVQNAYKTLIQLRDNPKLISIVTKIRTYDNMLMTSLKIPRDAKMGDVLKFTATFQEIRSATIQIISTVSKIPNGAKPVKAAKKPAEVTTVKADTRTNFLKGANAIVKGIGF